MTQDEVLLQTKKHVKYLLEKDGSGHDWWHIMRVYNNAELIMKTQKCNEFVTKLAILLHDIGDYKLHNGIDKTHELVYPFLKSLKLDECLVEEVLSIIKQISFSENKNNKPNSIEAMIAQDADRLDAIGAIGIARTFQYGGNKGRALYNPSIQPIINRSVDEYKKTTTPTINHFYEKLLLIKDLMNTTVAKKIAQERHSYMESFLKQFYDEWEGKK